MLTLTLREARNKEMYLNKMTTFKRYWQRTKLNKIKLTHLYETRINNSCTSKNQLVDKLYVRYLKSTSVKFAATPKIMSNSSPM